jgi:Rod binding domain-containing protein
MTDLSSLGSVSAVLPPDFNVNLNTAGNNEATRIKQVAKAMEMIFANQLSEELGKDIDPTNSDDPGSGSNVYGDFIQQAMSQGLTSGHGLGLAQQIESYLNRRDHPTPAPYMHTALPHAKPTS